MYGDCDCGDIIESSSGYGINKNDDKKQRIERKLALGN
jgi:hypothetical protein